MQIRHSRGELAITVFLFAVAVFFMWGAWYMPAGQFNVPGPGTVPLIAAALLALTCIALLVRHLYAKRSLTDDSVEMRMAPIAIIFAALTGVAIAFEDLGFIVTLSVFMFVMLRAFSRLKTVGSALAAVAITVAARWCFESLLGVTLPHW